MASRREKSCRRRPANGSRYKFKILLKFFDEAVGLRKIIAVVGIAHEDPFAGCGANAAGDRAAVAFFFHGNNARAGFFRDGLRAVGAAVVGDRNFAAHAGFLDSEFCFLNATRERFRLVETGHENCKFDWISHATNLIESHVVWRACVSKSKSGDIPIGGNVRRHGADKRQLSDFFGVIFFEPLVKSLAACGKCSAGQDDISYASLTQIGGGIGRQNIFNLPRAVRKPERSFNVVSARNKTDNAGFRRKQRAHRTKSVVALGIFEIGNFRTRQKRVFLPPMFQNGLRGK